MNWELVDEMLEGASLSNSTETANEQSINNLSKGKLVAPGVTLLVGKSGDILYHKSFGCRSVLPEMTPLQKDMVYDVASLTKAIASTTLVMKFVDQGKLSIDKKLCHILQSFATFGKDRITLRHLLTHTSGFPAHIAFYKKIAQLSKNEHDGLMHSREAVEIVYREILRLRTDNLPGKVAVYSDVGFIILGAALELIGGGLPFKKLVEQHVLGPLRLLNSGFIDINATKRGAVDCNLNVIIPTARCPWRNRIMLGEVHDDNAWVMGGIGGHAGLFSSAEDIHKFASTLLACWKGKGNYVDKEVVRMFWTKDKLVESSSWALGWDTPSQFISNRDNATSSQSSSGKYFSKSSVGHLGFTGCSLWIDPEKDLDIVLLTNRIHPSPSNEAIKSFRPAIHNLVMETLRFN